MLALPDVHVPLGRSLLPCRAQSTELPATTEGESSRGRSSQGHKAGLLTERFNLCLFNVYRVCVASDTWS